MKYTISCSCGKYTADFDNQDTAKTSAEMHIMLGKGHTVTCTRFRTTIVEWQVKEHEY